MDCTTKRKPAVDGAPGKDVSGDERIAALESANRELQSLVEYRSRLLARLAHELRNPLTSILGFAEILLNYEKLTTAQREFCQKIQNSAVQIESNLGLLSDLARFESGIPSLSIEEFSLRDALHQTCTVLKRQAAKQNTSIAWRADDEMPMLVSDRSKIRQLLYSFITNAISRSPSSAVLASAESHGEAFFVTIEDEGTEPFGSLPGPGDINANSLTSTGTAELGIAVGQKLLGVLGARLSYAAREPRGLKVTIEIPRRPADLSA
jgi:two-component system, NarL family, sensor histidine kinase BarA